MGILRYYPNGISAYHCTGISVYHCTRISAYHFQKVVPAPVNHFEVAKIRLPELVDSSCGMLELVFGGYDRINR